MAYNSTTGSLHVGDLLNEDDEDTQIDFGFDSIIFRTNRLPRFYITNNSVSASGPVSGSEFRAEVSLSSSRGVSGSSLQVGAYGWTNDGRINANYINAATALSSSQGITGSSLQIGPGNRGYGWTNAGTIFTNKISASNIYSQGAITAPGGFVSVSSSAGITGSSLQIGNYGWTNDGRASVNTLTVADSGKFTTLSASSTLQIAGIATFGDHVIPLNDNLKDLGSSAKRWRNIYTGDLHLKNERGDWTMIEEENYLTIRNNKTGKRFKLLMEEID